MGYATDGESLIMPSVALLFPANWSNVVSGPHLALPLLAGAAKQCGWNVTVHDLTRWYANHVGGVPTNGLLQSSVAEEDYQKLDSLYFAWEDHVASRASKTCAGRFGLLSGFAFPELERLELPDIMNEVHRATTPYTAFLQECVIPVMMQLRPEVIGITLASQRQLIACCELLILLRSALPQTVLVLGGNVVTRLRDTSVMDVLRQMVDVINVFQGEASFSGLLNKIRSAGVESIRGQRCRAVMGDEMIPPLRWPVPCFECVYDEQSVFARVLPYVSARGCYWGKCNFCAIPAGWSNTRFAGSLPGDVLAEQLLAVSRETGAHRFKLVDETFVPSKVRQMAPVLRDAENAIEWEAYARLDRVWEDPGWLEEAYATGLRKLYFGMEQSPDTDRVLLNKRDTANPLKVLLACHSAGVKAHLFCMVGYPGTSAADARLTLRFLLEHQNLIDTADLVAFRYDRGTTVEGIRRLPDSQPEWSLSSPYEAETDMVMSMAEVADVEGECVEAIWKAQPRLIHPLYRLMSPWK